MFFTVFYDPYEAAASVEEAAKDATAKTESDEDVEELLSQEKMVSHVLDDLGKECYHS